MPDLMENPRLNQSTAHRRPLVVGIFGISGCGKTTTANQLRQTLDKELYVFYEGSEMIAKLVPGGLDAFQKLEEQQKVGWRQAAIDTIQRDCAASGRVGVVVGHFMFWNEGEEVGTPVYTKNDLETYTHILYLEVPADVIERRRQDDAEKSRPSMSASHLRDWQQLEMTQLRDLCRRHDILFISLQPRLLSKASRLLDDFRKHSEEYNTSCAQERLDGFLLVGDKNQPETVLVMDADRTLAAEDTGTLFWKKISESQESMKECPLKSLFCGPLGYSYNAFRQATLLYEEAVDDMEFNKLCEEVASAVTMRTEFVSLLKLVAKEEYVRAVVVSCGLRRVWEKVLRKEGLFETVKVVGGGRISDGFVITAEVKASLVTRLREVHKSYVWAFGDSLLDLKMLSEADQAIVVVGAEDKRSKTIDGPLMDAIDGGLRARQVVLPNNASPRLDVLKLPKVELQDEFIDSILCCHRGYNHLEVIDGTEEPATKLLMTQTRDANVTGPALWEAHSRVGMYLALRFLAGLIGLDRFPIPHVQGCQAQGYRIDNEERTLIVTLMRGGLALAQGIHKAFPKASLGFASKTDDISEDHLRKKSLIMIVDSVVNSGTTAIEFIRHVRKLNAEIRIILVADVVQNQSIFPGSKLQELAHHVKFSLVALRLSENKYSGRGATDTGNRLFNTTDRT